MFNRKSIYALNKKDPDAIVYMDAAAIFLRVFIKGFIGASSFFTKSNALTILFSLLRPQRRFH